VCNLWIGLTCARNPHFLSYRKLALDLCVFNLCDVSGMHLPCKLGSDCNVNFIIKNRKLVAMFMK
jgi:hypothetical protein